MINISVHEMFLILNNFSAKFGYFSSRLNQQNCLKNLYDSEQTTLQMPFLESVAAMGTAQVICILLFGPAARKSPLRMQFAKDHHRPKTTGPT